MPVLEPAPVDIAEGGMGRSRIRLALDYLRVKRKPAIIALVTASIVGTAIA